VNCTFSLSEIIQDKLDILLKRPSKDVHTKDRIFVSLKMQILFLGTFSLGY
jgi:hypothetical protein